MFCIIEYVTNKTLNPGGAAGSQTMVTYLSLSFNFLTKINSSVHETLDGAR